MESLAGTPRVLYSGSNCFARVIGQINTGNAPQPHSMQLDANTLPG
jgi:hypothetical protein